ncbi:MAG: DUF5803 family protein [Halobacteriales archaeon]
MDRKYLAVVGLALLVGLSGCLGLFGGASEERLCENETYDYKTDANATFTVATNNTYKAVYDVDGQRTIELYETNAINNERPLNVRAVEFRAPDGTVYGCEDIEVEQKNSRTVVTLPAENGQFAYTAGGQPKRFSTHTFVDGSYEVVLPEDRKVRGPLIGSIRPSGHEVTTRNDRVHVTWESVDTRRVAVRYYLQRDVYLLLGVIGVAGAAALGGLAYYYRKIERLRRRREEAGLDVDIDDDDRRDPPPGMG